jgi:hypothetical protein
MLKAAVKRHGGSATVTLTGHLDEASEGVLTPLLPKLAKTDVLFDCHGIDQVNSIGFKAWIRFLKALETEATFALAQCGGAFLEYTGLMARTGYANRIVSVLVPYTCDGCRRTEQVTYELDEGMDGSEEFAEIICSKCNGLMTSDVAAEDHLAFRHG